MEWKISDLPVNYLEALDFMEHRARAIREEGASECVWLLEHPPLYTAGSSANPKDLLSSVLPVYETGRGGQYTYHGPGQRIAYVMLDLKKRGSDVRRFVQQLEAWIVAGLAQFGVQGATREGRIGVWVDTPAGEAKIAALGIRVRQWVSMHGIAINVHPDLRHYQGIVPCGIRGYGVTSLEALGIKASIKEIDAALQAAFGTTLSEAA